MDAPSPLLIRKIAQMFPERDPVDLLAQLGDYGTESHEREIERVELAILKLYEEDGAPAAVELVQAAKTDYRDVLAWAEFPGQMRGPVSAGSAEKPMLISRDYEQFQAWLER
ncbi:hypothetical protein [Deinococcus sp.]|uniref:hypothetical protein n=1 Tax=Deinococcus sp. TaxID=47478 RepID=UPI002869CA7E|nr:hypothetical protein [Deinococcus sp.]